MNHSQIHKPRMKVTVRFLFLITIVIVIPVTTSQQPKYSSCSSKEKCNECIQKFGCVWCADPDFQEKRCAEEGKSRCSRSFLMNPKIVATGNVSEPLTVPGKSDGRVNTNVIHGYSRKVIQLSPQMINVNLRPNVDHPYTFTLSYGQAKDYPVDLYYLMDLSHSMKDDKEKLSELGQKLSEEMTRITSDFRLGFGSFVDKVALPFVSIVPKSLREPCTNCAAPYGFRNVMSLSVDTSTFSSQVKLANVSGNLDAPEGGFDAIMQAIVCRQQIGWRNGARKLLVFSTDSTFHYAGDGKLAGIIKPNDGCCHLDDSGYYTKSEELDYPSVSQINLKVKENSINLIFAVTKEQTELYKRLGTHIEGASCGTLENDSSNVVQLVRDEYEKITSSVEMREKGLGNYLRVKYFTKCLNPNGPLLETNRCDGLKVGMTVDFNIQLELLQCPPDPKDWEHSFYIYPVGIEESMLVNVKMLCDCNCPAEDGSTKCSNHGILKCGVCECFPGFSGDDCNCTGEADKTDQCRQNNGAPICSDHGACKCNKCVCNSISETEVFWGKFCECNNFTCPRVGGKLCSGHGDCVCGKCVCAPGWIGDDCGCENDTSNCIIGNDTTICSGHGKCQCNKCVCDQEGGFFGKFCDKCPKCPTKCAELRDCVECKVHDTGKLSKKECDECAINIEVKEFIEVTDQDSFCSFYDERDCRFTFKYEFENKEIKVTAQKNKECPPQARILGVVFSVILSIVLIGLAFLLVWKFFTSMRDRREFAKFEKERMMAKWDSGQNPIYKQATSTFKNPTYCRS